MPHQAIDKATPATDRLYSGSRLAEIPPDPHRSTEVRSRYSPRGFGIRDQDETKARK
jgi:hypothetical protein